MCRRWSLGGHVELVCLEGEGFIDLHHGLDTIGSDRTHFEFCVVFELKFVVFGGSVDLGDGNTVELALLVIPNCNGVTGRWGGVGHKSYHTGFKGRQRRVGYMVFMYGYKSCSKSFVGHSKATLEIRSHISNRPQTLGGTTEFAAKWDWHPSRTIAPLIFLLTNQIYSISSTGPIPN